MSYQKSIRLSNLESCIYFIESISVAHTVLKMRWIYSKTKLKFFNCNKPIYSSNQCPKILVFLETCTSKSKSTQTVLDTSFLYFLELFETRGMVKARSTESKTVNAGVAKRTGLKTKAVWECILLESLHDTIMQRFRMYVATADTTNIYCSEIHVVDI